MRLHSEWYHNGRIMCGRDHMVRQRDSGIRLYLYFLWGRGIILKNEPKTFTLTYILSCILHFHFVLFLRVGLAKSLGITCYPPASAAHNAITPGYGLTFL